MSLARYFQKLYQTYGEQPVQPGLPELAAQLCVSERHARQLLGRMQGEGWLTWQAGRGRGVRSTLQLHGKALQQLEQELQQLLQQGALSQVLQRLPAAERQQWLDSLPRLLAQHDAGSRLRIPLPRALKSLDPLTVAFWLEANLVRQLFDRLLEVDPQRGLVGSLAHHWEAQQQGQCWRFWLRPRLQFHDGSVLDSTAVMETLLRLRDEPGPAQWQYRHLRRVVCHDALGFSCELERPDWLWPHCLANGPASIVPRRRRRHFGELPVGSGPWRLLQRHPGRLLLQAMPYHHRGAPLLEQIELWILDLPDYPAPYDLVWQQEEGQPVHSEGLHWPEGCHYLILGEPDDNQRQQLAALLSHPPLVADDEVWRRPAHHLLASWPPMEGTPAGRISRPPAQVLTLQHFGVPQASVLLPRIRQRLSMAGITLTVLQRNAALLQEGTGFPRADLTLQGEILSEDTIFSLYEWLGGNIIEHLPPLRQQALWRALARIQAMPGQAEQLAGFQQEASHLIQEGWLLPLSHEANCLHPAPWLAGAKPGNNGWVDFSKLWVRGDSTQPS
ncbi:SgrR family transcriptional regulator [Leeia aquatica]|uniref:SgrR family transcriptional regulator n=1 Tax=Leeia aquatica TaxID=2725557 RepID=A0A847SJV9_9NEIS|nr:SgrR family transcriptional regulator [Leeia aquatica]NLR76202.1 hypothetical protein [Leeia aquatica]